MEAYKWIGWIVATYCLTAGLRVLDCMAYDWYFPEVLGPDRRCGPELRKDQLTALQTMLGFLMAYLGGRASR